MPDPVELNNIAEAIEAFQEAGKPNDLAPKVKAYVQQQYDSLNSKGYWNQPANASIGHSLRAGGYVSDPTQGGAAAPEPSVSDLEYQRHAASSNPNPSGPTAFTNHGMMVVDASKVRNAQQANQAVAARQQQATANAPRVAQAMQNASSPTPKYGLTSQAGDVMRGVGEADANIARAGFAGLTAPLWAPMAAFTGTQTAKQAYAPAVQFGNNFVKSAGKFAGSIPGAVVQGGKAAIHGMAASGLAQASQYAGMSGDVKNAQQFQQQSAGELKQTAPFVDAFANGLTGGPNGAAAKSYRAIKYLSSGNPQLAAATAQNVINGIGKEAWNDPVQFAANVAAVGGAGMGALAKTADAMSLAERALKAAAIEARNQGKYDIQDAALSQANKLSQASQTIKTRLAQVQGQEPVQPAKPVNSIAQQHINAQTAQGSPAKPLGGVSVKAPAAINPNWAPYPGEAGLGPKVVTGIQKQVKGLAQQVATTPVAKNEQEKGGGVPPITAPPESGPVSHAQGVTGLPPTSESIPQSPANGTAKTEEAKQSTGANYTGSINLNNRAYSPEAVASVRQRAKEMGLDDKEKLSDDELLAKARGLGVTIDTLKGVRPGEIPYPEGEIPRHMPAAYSLAVRELDTHWQNAAQVAKRIAKNDPTPENVAAAKTAQANADLTHQHADALAYSQGRGLASYNIPAEPFSAIRQGDLFRGTQNAKRVGTRTVARRVTSKDFLETNGPFLSQDTQAALERMKTRFEGIKDLSGCK